MSCMAQLGPAQQVTRSACAVDENRVHVRFNFNGNDPAPAQQQPRTNNKQLWRGGVSFGHQQGRARDQMQCAAGLGGFAASGSVSAPRLATVRGGPSIADGTKRNDKFVNSGS